MLLNISCGIQKKDIRKKEFSFSSQEQELEYYYAFTEATKQAIFNNYKDAINLYNKCLKYNPNSAAANFQLSNIYMRIGEYDMAKAFAQRALKIEGDNIWYYLHLASLYQMRRQIDSTIVIYEKIVDLEKGRNDYLFNLALLYNENRNYDKALKTIKRVESAEGTNEKIIYFKHELFSKLGKRRDAIKELENGIYYFDDDINMYGLLAEYYSETGEYENADSLYKEMIRKDSANLNVRLSYADFLLNFRNENLAFKLYTSTIIDNQVSIEDKIKIIMPLIGNEEVVKKYRNEIRKLVETLREKYDDNIDVMFVCIDFNIQDEKYEKASEDLKIIVKQMPENINAWKQLLYIENYMNNYDSVLILSERAIEKFDHEVSFYIMKGLALLQKGDNNHAIEILLEGEKHALRKEEKVQIYSYLAELYRNIKDDNKSDFYFDEALGINKNNLIIRNNYSYYLALRDTALRKAEELSRYTIEKEPENPTYLDTYAWILFKMGKERKALKYIEMAIKYDNDDNREILEHYADILFKMSKYKEAIRIWKGLIGNNVSDTDIKEKIKIAEDFIK